MAVDNSQARIARFAIDAKPPAATLGRVRLRAIDALGCAIAGSAHELFEGIRASLGDWGRGGETLAMSSGSEMPLLQAIALDSAAMRLWDHDDVDDATGDHPSVSTVPVALALAKQRRISAVEWLAAIAVAQEVQLRIRMGSSQRLGISDSSHPWTTGTYAPFGSAVVTSRLLSGNLDHMVASLGNAFAYASNTAQSQSEGGNVHLFHQGLATALGVQAARAVDHGVTGIRDVFEGRFGLYRALHRAAGPNILLTDQLGSAYNVDRVSMKRFPSCRHSHGFIEVALSARREAWLSDVAEISVGLGESAIAIMTDGPDVPRTAAEGAFHFRFLFALAVSRGTVDMAEFLRLGGDQQDDVRAWMDRISILRDETLSVEDARAATANVTFSLHGGRSRMVTARPRPMDARAVRQKFIQSVMRGRKCTAERASPAYSTLTSVLTSSEDVGVDVARIFAAL